MYGLVEAPYFFPPIFFLFCLFEGRDANAASGTRLAASPHLQSACLRVGGTAPPAPFCEIASFALQSTFFVCLRPRLLVTSRA